MADIQDDDIFKYAHVISINETHLSPTDNYYTTGDAFNTRFYNILKGQK